MMVIVEKQLNDTKKSFIIKKISNQQAHFTFSIKESRETFFNPLILAVVKAA